MDEKLKKKLAESFTIEELDQIEKLLNRGFILIAQKILSEILISAKKKKIPITGILARYERQFVGYWYYHQFETRGNPLVVGYQGKENLRFIKGVCKEFGIDVPSEAILKVAKVPNTEFIVQTEDATYQFGNYETGGVRKVFASPPVVLPDKKCFFTHLVIGEPMSFEYHPKIPEIGGHRSLSNVVSIKQLKQ